MIAPRWLHHTITLSAVYGILWGVVHLIWPEFSFCKVLKAEPDAVRIIFWSLIVFVAVNVGTLYALRAPVSRRTWFVVGGVYHLISTVGVGYALVQGWLTPGFWLALVLNHALWVLPYALMAAWAIGADWHLTETLNYLHGTTEDMDLATIRTSQGHTLAEMSANGPVMLVFLRHFGCTFCRHTLSQLKHEEKCLAERGTRTVLVHMTTDDVATAELNRFGLGHMERISDPDCSLYGRFGLEKGNWSELMGPKVLYRGVVLGIFKGLGIGSEKGDMTQMPGIFLLHKGRVVKAFRHQTAADMPDIAFLSEVD
jgi:hypothetical protein